MNLLDIAENLTKIITVPLLIFLGVIVTYIWLQLEKFYNQQTKLRELERDIFEAKAKFLESKIESAQDLKAQVDIIKESNEIKLEKLKLERDTVSENLNLAIVDKEKYFLRINELQNEIDTIQKDQNQYFQTLAHEMVTPINALYGHVSFIKEWILKKRTIENIEIKINDVLLELAYLNSLISLIQHSYLYSSSGKITCDFSQKFSLNDIINNTLNVFKEKIDKKNIRIIKNLGNIPVLYLDKFRIQLTIFNIIDNAIKYSDLNKKEISIDTFLGFNEVGKEKYIIFEISNWGSGILENESDNIFLKYSRGYNALKYSNKGSGLGLWISKRILNEHDTKFYIKNLKNPTTFSIRFPIYLKDKPPNENN
ncbi:MAG: HAMP domain-containing sensor histidine kinase [Ignavibacteriae bacterium]|nr:HAMP domain-containing sensor histidine kinase [Ignavibacteriota bacterium]